MKPVLNGIVLAFVAVVAIAAAQAPALRILVLEGEDAVNIVQQKTAVSPLVEIRDRNDLPVAGATVQFTLAGGTTAGAFANGQSVITVTTNAVGRATAPQLQAIGNGALRINVQASFQGQIATATVTQTNFATSAAAAAAGRTPTAASGGGASATSGATGAGGAGAGGVAGTAAGIAAAATSGLVVAQQASGSGCSSVHNTFMTDLGAAQDACLAAPNSAQCGTAGQQGALSLGEWCTCDGAANVDTELRAIGTSIAQLSALAGLRGIAIPASCR